MKYALMIITILPTIAWAHEVRIGSKKFTESVILGEIVRLTAKQCSLKTDHKKELGGTRILWSALLNGDIDIYPEYTGTIREEILSGKRFKNFVEIEDYLKNRDISVISPLGFNNTYILGMMKSRARELNIEKISDLNKSPDLILGFGNEFMNRGDGWLALKKTYMLTHKNIRGLDHDLAYRGLISESIDVMDLYATDAEIEYYDLKVLEDDKKHFPEYNALLLYRSELNDKAKSFISAISNLRNRIDDNKMIQMNSMVKLLGMPSDQVAADFLNSEFQFNIKTKKSHLWVRFKKNTSEHIFLVLISLSAAILLAIPLGIFSVYHKKAGHLILSIAGVIQTIPSLAILVFMIPLLGIGAGPAMMALFLYSLLPIIRNTYSGIMDIPGHLIESADALGLTKMEKLRFLELPLAARSILSGIKIAAVINVGVATLGALIGAGGYGQPILTGIRLDDFTLILEGAIPAALLALLFQGAFDLLEKLVVSRGLRFND